MKAIYRKIRDIFGQHNSPTESNIKQIVERFYRSRSLEDQRVEDGRSGCSSENLPQFGLEIT